MVGTADKADASATPGETTPEQQLQSVLYDHEDGKVTFTRPGVESREFSVKDGEIRTNLEGYEWLLRHVVGQPTA